MRYCTQVVCNCGAGAVFSLRVTSTGSLPPTRQSSMSSCPRIDSGKYRGARYSETVFEVMVVLIYCVWRRSERKVGMSPMGHLVLSKYGSLHVVSGTQCLFPMQK